VGEYRLRERAQTVSKREAILNIAASVAATHFNSGRHHAIRNRNNHSGKSGAACAGGDGGMTGYDWFKVPTYKPVVPESRQVAEMRDRLIKLGVRDEIKSINRENRK
jgi:hypothetical protein